MAAITHFNANLSFTSMEGVALVYFPAKSPSAAEVDALRAHLYAVAARAPKGIGLLLVIPEVAGPPDGAVREQVIAMFRSMRGRMPLVVAVLEGEGFGAAAKRAVFTLLMTSSLGANQVKAVPTASAGCDWMAERAAKSGIACPAAIDLHASLDELRKRP
jgi:hypothetical protein